MKRLVGFGLVAAILVMPEAAWCNVQPTPGAGDPHLQTVRYDPQQVVSVGAAMGYQVVVAFPPGEQIESVALGDSHGWQVSVSHGQQTLFIKPTRDAAPTNLTVIGVDRLYAFDLTAQDNVAPNSPYVIVVELEPPHPAPAPVSVTAIRYDLQGDRILFPDRIFDDGRFTYIVWPVTADLPAVFKKGQGGEALVNGTMRDGVFIVDEVAPQLVFRAGAAVATASRRATKAAGTAHE